MDLCYTQANGCGRSYKYKSIHNFNDVNYQNHFKNSIGDNLDTKNSYAVKELCKYFLMATLNIVFSFLRIVELCGKLPKILIPA
jgi:hypothetical protein